MGSFIQGDRAVHALLNPAHTVDSIDTSNLKHTALLAPIVLNPSSSTKDKFGEEVPVLGKNWHANCTADSSIKALHEAEYCPENHITFGTRYTISYFTKEGVPIDHPVEDFIEEPIRVKKLMFNRQRASNLADTLHLASGRHIDLQKPFKMESDTIEHPRQPMIPGYFDIHSEVSLSSIKDKCVDERVTITPVPSNQDKPSIDSSLGIKISNTISDMATVGLQVVDHLDEKPATRAQFSFHNPDHESTEQYSATMPATSYQDNSARDGSFGCRVSNTMRNVASIGLQVVNDLDEKAAARAQFSFDGAKDQYSDNHVTTMPLSRRHDKSSTNSSLGSRVSSSMRNLAEAGLQVIHDLDEKAARHARFSLDSPTPIAHEPANTIQTNPFEKWLHTIKRRGGHRKATSCDMPRNGIEGGIYERPNTTESRPGHRKSLSGSSFGFVSNMKSVGTSLASFSIAPRSRTGVSSRHQRTDYSSRASYAGRASEDNSNCLSRGFILDKDVLKRMEQRQGVIEEILSTEKAYLDDIRALIRVFDGLLLAIPILSQSLRKSIALTLKDIWTHNNELYNELVKVVANTNKFSGVISVDLPSHPPVKGHKRWQSLGEVPASESTESRGRHIGDPKVAGEIAKVFCGKVQTIPGLFLYESYGIMHKELMKQIHTAYRTTDEWKDFNQAIRSTEEMIVSTDNRKSGSQKGRIFEDYFIKPESRSRDKIRTLEQNHLCGVLHACWQTKDTVAGHNITGQYFIALLYEKFFVLAQPSGNQDEFYAVQACIPISELSVEDVDNGKGLQCHTAPHSWKIVFEHISQLFEIIMSACSAKEELEWKSRLIDRSGKQCDSTVQQEMTASLSLDLKPMGTIYGKPGTTARRKSIHRATTMKGQTTIPRSVIVRNTSAATEPSLSSSSSQLSINRSQSLAGPHRPTILAPPRTERVRLETLLADVWTRDIIPYPGMGSKPHREHTVRASATSMMRKISHASISSITKRSGTGSIASLHKSEDHTATELDSLRPMILNRQARHNSSDSIPLPDLEHSVSQDTSSGRHGSRLAVIIDEKESNPSTNGARSTSGSPIMARLASFRSKKSEGSLADSLISKLSTASKSPSGKSSLALPVVTAAHHGEELRKENVLHLLKMLDDGVDGEEAAGDLLQAQQRKGRNRTMLVEGFKNFFR
ncbi:hypothetical protein SS1G_04527 [Sclerotinia sclerotiorum 1980 UF-70]|uniref:DH domain-containing protein n=1 Tax=Sclerotinia sclerotiorum (strain ATCC 18683 / 1980 / Ss-1) TaxID=665079 RepID=A7EGT5_SCLS1|nr:hypothetical protein SS1G_04527 [Sclerotinia sclerotiorum 1980 UF-70]EDO02051.1 hypothetical protein SS1G_04527 [Sclerotinia sclerotiorum 1980 UF-70]